VTKTRTSLVAWSSVTAGAATNFTKTLFGVTVFDQPAAIAFMLANGPDQMSGAIFDNTSDAAAFAATHTSHPYTLVTMTTDVQPTGPSLDCVVDTYSKKSIGGPKDLGNIHGPDTTPGDLTFPLYIPLLKSNGHEADHGENFLYSDPDWAIGFYNDFNPWPGGQWSDVNLSNGFSPGVPLGPAVTFNLEVVPGDKSDPTIPPSRIHTLPPS